MTNTFIGHSWLLWFFLFVMCPGLNSLSHAHSRMDSHMLNWEIDIENREVCHSWHPYDVRHSLFKWLRLTHQADWGIRPQISFKHQNVDFNWALLHFYKVVRLFSKTNCDALISWYIMRLRGPAIPVAPLFSAGCKQHELRGEQCSHECNSIGRIWLGSCFSKYSSHVSLPNDSKSYVACHWFSVLRLSQSFYSLEMLKGWLKKCLERCVQWAECILP